MPIKQHTIAQAVSLSGIGLHQGLPCTITFLPAPENHGYCFRRIDLQGNPLVRATIENVKSWERSTTLAENNVEVQTVEHVLAALAGSQLDNVLIEISGPEPPIMDGSALPFVQALHNAGKKEQEAKREYFVIEEPIYYQNSENQSEIFALPGEKDIFHISVSIDYHSKIVGIQNATLQNFGNFAAEIAPARTFCFLHELLPLLKAGLIKGGSIENAVVIVEESVADSSKDILAQQFNLSNIEIPQQGYLNNTPLRFENEFARHKLLDLIGDLALVGAPLIGKIIALKPGHQANIGFSKLLYSKIQQKKIIRKYQKESANQAVFDINAIEKILPHRYPFLLVDRITNFTADSIEGIKNVTINEPFFSGHFQGNPIMPGVLLLESMAQVGGILLLNIIENPQDHWVYLVAIDNVRFKKTVVPGDQVIFKVKLQNMKRNICKMHGKAFVGDTLVSEADFVASLIKKNL
ncbi:MAG: bifunctional UDP-3-O-[3-hydroxymyristoyl] N-acetylglucosamine deacetylase/3-hydroxyacyl-ACP dehydratase [Bacteroidia bacterium]|nr:bifunctional UDP-3-O-[3-hydroxymyristoyl] N-acetylglucosamine deacetylase/3-hydroxyacyl-ACP dehydratase [Bacteroidia bacterium]MDW8157307.1 bifunctional UDP-3-O-[3-hydroxymyristoyl] N-acetylglucosamine deacetylase/3-hydroxyacyl-ACP dehydratase [Bacteroidia bacterium]